MGGELLEREPQLDALARWWSEAAAGSGRLVFVTGEAGVGKTSLVRALCTNLPATASVVVGTCEPLTTPLALGPLFDMLPALSDLFDDLLAEGADPRQLRRAFLEEIGSGRSGTLVVIEDAHWADDATLDLLRHVGRRLGGRRTMVVVTYRDDEVGPRHPPAGPHGRPGHPPRAPPTEVVASLR
jgi:predicted ATPase